MDFAVDESGDVPVIYVAEGDWKAVWGGPDLIGERVKQCTWDTSKHEFSCSVWKHNVSRVTTDGQGAVYALSRATTDGPTWSVDVYSLWKCSASAACTPFAPPFDWHIHPQDIEADSRGNVYVSGTIQDGGMFVKKCK